MKHWKPQSGAKQSVGCSWTGAELENHRKYSELISLSEVLEDENYLTERIKRAPKLKSKGAFKVFKIPKWSDRHKNQRLNRTRARQEKLLNSFDFLYSPQSIHYSSTILLVSSLRVQRCKHYMDRLNSGKCLCFTCHDLHLLAQDVLRLQNNTSNSEILALSEEIEEIIANHLKKFCWCFESQILTCEWHLK